jgi:hypothetical protein
MSTEKKTWLGRLFQKLAAWVSTADDKLHDAAMIANNIGNAVVKAMASPQAQLLLDEIEMVVPASTGLVEALKLQVPVIVNKVHTVSTVLGTSGEQQAMESLASLALIAKSDPDLFATKVDGIVALVIKFISDNQGLGATIQQVLPMPQIVHNPDLVNVPVAAVAA